MSSSPGTRTDPPADLTPLVEFRSAMDVLFAGLDCPMAWRLAIATLLALAGGALAGLAPVALKLLIDAASLPASDAGRSLNIAGFGVAYLLSLAVARLIAEFRPFLIGAVEQRLYARLRLRYFSHVLDLPLSFHLARQTGALGHHLQLAVTGYQVILSCLINGLVPVLVEAITVCVVLLSLGQPALAINFGVTAFAIWLVVGSKMPVLRASASAVTDASARAHGHIADSLINYEPVKCFGAGPQVLARLQALCTSLEQSWQDLHARRLGMGAAVTTVFALSLASSLAIAIQGLSQGRLSLGGFVLATLYMVQIIRPLELLSSAARDVSQGLAFVRPLLDTLKSPTDPAPLPEPDCRPRQSHERDRCDFRAAAPAGVAVSFQGVRLSFGRRDPVLVDLNLDIPAGRSLALVGASGAGKSSVVRLLLRLCEPDAGCIRLDGVRIDALPIQQLRAMIAVVPQDLALLNNTIKANIALGQEDATASSIAQAARLAGLHDVIAALPCGYDTVIGERGLTLSGGERQRIAIARAILRDPRLYVFDEATSMLDPRTEEVIMQRVKALSKGRTVLLIAHRLSAARHADEIAVLDGGRIAERGDHATLLACGGVYAGLWRSQDSAHAPETMAEHLSEFPSDSKPSVLGD